MHIAGFMSFSYSHDIKILNFSETCLWCEALLCVCVGGGGSQTRRINPWSNIGLCCYWQEESSEISIITFWDYEVDLSSLPFINLTAEAICIGEFHRRVFTYYTVYCPTGPEGEMDLLYEKWREKNKDNWGPDECCVW